MNQINRKLNFFRNCNRANGQAQTLWDVYSSKVSLRHVVSVDAWNSDGLLQIDAEYQDLLAKTLHRYSRESSLVLCHTFINIVHHTIKLGQKSKGKLLSCPFYYYPAEYSDEGIRIDHTRGVINPAAKSLLSVYPDEIQAHIESTYLSSKNIIKSLSQKGIVESHDQSEVFNGLASMSFEPAEADDINQIYYTDDAVSKVRRSKREDLDQGQSLITNDYMLGVIPKPKNAQGVSHELEELTKHSSYSLPLRTILLEETDQSLTSSENADVPMPMVLSEPQESVLNSTEEHAVSVLLGPPGTGKTYTIASLALHEYLKGNSVLVVSDGQHAVDVVRQKLIDDFNVDSRLTVLASDKGVSRDVQKQVRQILSLTDKFDAQEFKDVTSKLNQAISKQKLFEQKFEEVCAQYTGEIVEPVEQNLYQRLLKFFSDSFKSMQIKGDLGDDFDASDALLNDYYLRVETWTDEVHLLSAKYINMSYRKLAQECATSNSVKTTLMNFSEALAFRNGQQQKEKFNALDFSHVIQALPIWFASLGNLARTLPLRDGLFDVVIFDEATQCDIASSLPAIARAKRIVVVGDQKQLKHFSFISFDEQAAFYDQYQLKGSGLSSNYRGQSLIDYTVDCVTQPSQIHQLDEHFRSEPQIIAFSNQHFYDNSLKIMTQRPKVSPNVVNLIQCKGRYVLKKNIEEAERLLAFLREQVDAQAKLPRNEAHSFGILSFFSRQASYIEQKMFESFTLAELRKHDIRCGTPFSFQGEERDHMLISCTIDASTANSSYIYLNRDDVFNVAVTRARDCQTLFLSCEENEVSPTSKLRSYIDFYKTKVDSQSKSLNIKDSYQDEVCSWLVDHDVEVFRNYVIAGTSIDIIAVYLGKSIAIDLIGFDGELKPALPLQQYQLLSRAGLQSLLLPHQEWQDRRKELEELLLKELGVVIVPQLENQLTGEQASFDLQELDDKFTISISELEQRLSQFKEPRAKVQLSLLVKNYISFNDVLARCFTQGEITYSRYFNAFSSLMNISLNNLDRASTVLEVVVGQIELQKHQTALHSNSELFEQRQVLIDEQRSVVDRYLQGNEAALMQMAKTILKLNLLKSAPNDTNVNMQEAQEILNEMTEKLYLYQ